jgi:pyruvate dehydrogenase E1 component alpha subunit
MAAAARNAGRAGSGAAKTAGKRAAPNAPQFTKEEELQGYREMLLIRRFEEKAGQMYGMGLIGGFCHLYIGQEAVVVGMQMASREGDQVITGYRDHGHMLACGMDPKGVMAELTGRRGGYSRGKGRLMHMFSKESTSTGGHGIVGAQVSLGTGLGFANWYREDAACDGLFRRGAANPGPGLRKLQHGGALEAAGRLRHREQPQCHGHLGDPLLGADDFSKRGVSFNIPGEQVDGMDVRAVAAAGSAPSSIARSGQRAPTSSRCRPTATAATPCPTREVPHQGRGRPHARGAGPDRAGPAPLWSVGVTEDELKASTAGAGVVQRGGGVRHPRSRARRASSTPTSCSEAQPRLGRAVSRAALSRPHQNDGVIHGDRHPHARPLSRPWSRASWPSG